jgi:hypothetical protein
MPTSRKPRTFNISDPSNLTEIEKNRIVTVAEASELSSISEDSWYRNHRDKLVPLSEKRVGVRLKHALFLAD